MSVIFRQETFVSPSILPPEANKNIYYPASAALTVTGPEKTINDIIYDLIQNKIMQSNDCVVSSNEGSRLYIIRDYYDIHDNNVRVWNVVRFKIRSQNAKCVVVRALKNNVISEIERSVKAKLQILV